MRIVGYVFLGIFAIALIYGIYSISKILAIAKIRKMSTQKKCGKLYRKTIANQ